MLCNNFGHQLLWICINWHVLHWIILIRFVFKIKMPSDVRIHLINDMADIEYVAMSCSCFICNYPKLLCNKPTKREKIKKEGKNRLIEVLIELICGICKQSAGTGWVLGAMISCNWGHLLLLSRGLDLLWLLLLVSSWQAICACHFNCWFQLSTVEFCVCNNSSHPCLRV